jgi:hypothetical protein
MPMHRVAGRRRRSTSLPGAQRIGTAGIRCIPRDKLAIRRLDRAREGSHAPAAPVARANPRTFVMDDLSRAGRLG